MTGPVWVTSTQVAERPVHLEVPRRAGEPYGRARVLVRHGDAPLRFVERTLDTRSDVVVLDGADVAVPAGGVPADALQGRISVVVCTRDRADQLELCLAALLLLDDDDFEVVVVDNSDTPATTAAVLASVAAGDARFRMVHEPDPGLSRARNRGLWAAAGVVVAFTDDDVRVDPCWLRGIRAGFGHDEQVGCVTGLVPAAELEDPVQEIFDKKVSWSSSLDRRRYSMATDSGRGAFPYDAGRFGTGANFAVRRDLMRALGGFDVALGAGSASLGGEDLDAFVRVLLAGRELVYEPRALVWHVHRISADALADQVYSYGVGLSAYITKLLVGPMRWDVLRRTAHGAAVFLTDKRAERGAGLPRRLLLRELAGCLAGPLLYLRARRRATS